MSELAKYTLKYVPVDIDVESMEFITFCTSTTMHVWVAYAEKRDGTVLSPNEIAKLNNQIELEE